MSEGNFITAEDVDVKDDWWKSWEPLGIEGCEEFDKRVQKIKDLTLEGEKLKDKCMALCEEGDITNAKIKEEELLRIKNEVGELVKSFKEDTKNFLDDARKEHADKMKELKAQYSK